MDVKCPSCAGVVICLFGHDVWYSSIFAIKIFYTSVAISSYRCCYTLPKTATL